jgi:geranylgeranyl diphosphate synthase, type II
MLQTAGTLDQYLAAVRPRIEAALTASTELDRRSPPRLTEAIRYSLLSGGKRLRPVLVLLAAEACGTEEADAMPAACAVEMIHAYSLIHDDLPAMDDDDLRRGQPTNHKVYGEAMAILAGDALLTLAFETLAKKVRPMSAAGLCCAALAQAAGALGMVGGQADDILREQAATNSNGSHSAGVNGNGANANGANGNGANGHLPDTLEALESIHARKTGALLSVSLELGALVAEASPEEKQALAEYGRALGLAFQITDDLLDVEGDEATVGKRVGKDSDKGKLTFPGLLGVEESRRRAESLIAEACGALAPFGNRAHRLEALAHYVLERNR